jgi:[lysine-biosynthesis-protein LysW]--L-2-aminoadipate ligase
VTGRLESGGRSAPPRGSHAHAEVFVVGSPANRTSVVLTERWRSQGLIANLLSVEDAERAALPGDLVLGRLDVLPGLDGVEPGLLALLRLERTGVAVLNRSAALLAAHDKLLTAQRLAGAGIRHPRTLGWRGAGLPPIAPPVVVKPRFGSWGRDVFRCDDRETLAGCLAAVRDRRWFRRHGAVIQELVRPRGYDLRVLVAGGQVVGATERVAAPGEWRTNVSLGGSLRSIVPTPEACSMALAAAAAIDADLVGVDLLLDRDDRLVVLELNGAAEFDERYSVDGGDVYLAVAESLGLAAGVSPKGVRDAPDVLRR